MASTATTASRITGLAGEDRDHDDLDAAPLPQLLTFQVGGRSYGCPLGCVREILVARPTTRLPGAPPHVLGLLNLRGILLTVLDLRTLLDPDAGRPRAEAAGHVLVVDVDGRQAGCRVDGVQRVGPLPALDSAAAGNVGGGGVVMGVGEVDGAALAVLDLPAIVRQTLLFPGER